jgi:hypothetical protein
MTGEDLERLRDLLEMLREQGVTSATLPASAGLFAGMVVTIAPRVVRAQASTARASEPDEPQVGKRIPAGLGPVVG